MTEAELRDAGITPGLLRISVGLEDLEDLAGRLRGGAGGRAGGVAGAVEQPAVGV